jgi:hypothetical protein
MQYFSRAYEIPILFLNYNLAPSGRIKIVSQAAIICIYFFRQYRLVHASYIDNMFDFRFLFLISRPESKR